MKFRALALFALVAALSACGSTMTTRGGIVRPSFETTYREGERQTANVGDYMTSTVQFAIRKGFNTPRDIVARDEGRDWTFTAPAGTYVLAGESDEGQFYSARDGLGSTTDPAYGGVFIPANTNTITAIVLHWVPWAQLGERGFSVYEASVGTPVTVPEIKTVMEPVSSGMWSTLSYLGVSGGQIKFAYKEFTADGLARDAFTQEVTFDYKPGETYGYKHARFVVHEAGTTEITFTLMSHL
ncbi:MAG: hypothetical protein ACT4NL_07230 [Pseudomarimonas sp.]